MKQQLLEKINKYLISKVKKFEQIIESRLRIHSPVRSGKLLDTMLNFLRIDIIRTTLKMSTYKPIGYPDIIIGAKHHGEKMGWADSYVPTNRIDNRVLIEFGDGGQDLFLLNDPHAMENYRDIMREKSSPAIIDNVLYDFPDYTGTIIWPKEPGQNIQVILTEVN